MNIFEYALIGGLVFVMWTLFPTDESRLRPMFFWAYAKDVTPGLTIVGFRKATIVTRVYDPTNRNPGPFQLSRFNMPPIVNDNKPVDIHLESGAVLSLSPYKRIKVRATKKNYN